MRLFYLANIRLPTEKAHGLQIMQNCEAFAACGAAVTLYVARRTNTPELAQVRDPWAHYGVARSFALRRVPCLDLLPLRSSPLTFGIQFASYLLFLCLILMGRRAEVYYSRDMLTLLLLSLFRPRRALAYEAHQVSKSRLGGLLQRLCVRRVGTVIAVTGRLADKMRVLGARHVIAEHDGYRAARFAGLPGREDARRQLGLPGEAFIVGYVGRLHTMHMSKGVDTLVEAAGRCDRPLSLCLVGGPEDMAEVLRARWLALGLPGEQFISVGQVSVERVPLYLAAFDVCALALPWTEHFAYYASPLKLFEYMAVGGAILVSDLPGIAEVVRDDETALLVPPGDVDAVARAYARLYDGRELRIRLGVAARREAARYTWEARAGRILLAIREAI